MIFRRVQTIDDHDTIGSMEKLCTGPCGLIKLRKEFYKRSNAKDGLQAWCKECMKARNKKNRKPIDPKKQRAFTLKHRYGISVEQWDQMLIAQSGLCNLCDEPMKSPHVDHSHTTLAVRSLLCLQCNTMLGHVEQLGIPRIQEYLLAERIILPQSLEVVMPWKSSLYRAFLSSSYN